MATPTTERLVEVLSPIIETFKVELVDLEYSGSILRITVEREGGLDLSVISRLTRQISNYLDENDPIDGRYTLEVSSPGLERALRTPEHFIKAVGRTVNIKVDASVGGDWQLPDHSNLSRALLRREGLPRRPYGGHLRVVSTFDRFSLAYQQDHHWPGHCADDVELRLQRGEQRLQLVGMLWRLPGLQDRRCHGAGQHPDALHLRQPLPSYRGSTAKGGSRTRGRVTLDASAHNYNVVSRPCHWPLLQLYWRQPAKAR